MNTQGGVVVGNRDGIFSQNFGSGTLAIIGDAETGEQDGIDVRNYSASSVTVTTVGAVIGEVDTSGIGHGITAHNSAVGASMNIDALNTVNGDADGNGTGFGNYARNEGTDGIVTAIEAVQGGQDG